MKSKIIKLVFFSLFISCSTQHKRGDIYNISKNCETIKNENPIYYQMCKDWNLLTASDIQEIVKYSEEIPYSKDINFIHSYGFAPDGIYMTAKLKKNNKIYDILLGSESWMLITDSLTQESKLYSCQNPKITKYFIGNYVTESTIDDNPELEERYNQKRQ